MRTSESAANVDHDMSCPTQAYRCHVTYRSAHETRCVFTPTTDSRTKQTWEWFPTEAGSP